jgi:hypothetical protein
MIISPSGRLRHWTSTFRTSSGPAGESNLTVHPWAEAGSAWPRRVMDDLCC